MKFLFAVMIVFLIISVLYLMVTMIDFLIYDSDVVRDLVDWFKRRK